MSPSQPFILRPVATTLLMIAIMLSGMLAFRFLPVAALPEVDYPTIQVQTFYPGASPDVMTSSVTAPLEVQFGQMPNLNQMSSVSSAGASVITLQFGLSISLDVAEQEVQAAINAAGNLLPSDLPAPPIYAKVNPADAPILTLGLTSKTMPLTQVEDFVDTRLAQKISQLPGVGLVSISGGQRPAVRIRADIRKLAAYGLNIDDLRTTLGNANVNTPKGNFDGGDARLHHQRQRPDQQCQRLQIADRRLQERLAGPAQRCRRRHRRRPERQARRLDERDTGHHPEYPAATRRQRHFGGRGHQGAAAATAGLAARRDRRQHSDRPHRDHPRFGAGRGIRIGARRHPGGAGDLRVPAQRAGNPDPEPVGAAVAGRHARRHVPVRLQPQQSFADGADHRHRLRGRRRHRRDRKHLPLHRRGRSASAGGACAAPSRSASPSSR